MQIQFLPNTHNCLAWVTWLRKASISKQEAFVECVALGTGKGLTERWIPWVFASRSSTSARDIGSATTKLSVNPTERLLQQSPPSLSLDSSPNFLPHLKLPFCVCQREKLYLPLTCLDNKSHHNDTVISNKGHKYLHGDVKFVKHFPTQCALKPQNKKYLNQAVFLN